MFSVLLVWMLGIKDVYDFHGLMAQILLHTAHAAENDNLLYHTCKRNPICTSSYMPNMCLEDMPWHRHILLLEWVDVDVSGYMFCEENSHMSHVEWIRIAYKSRSYHYRLAWRMIDTCYPHRNLCQCAHWVANDDVDEWNVVSFHRLSSQTAQLVFLQFLRARPQVLSHPTHFSVWHILNERHRNNRSWCKSSPRNLCATNTTRPISLVKRLRKTNTMEMAGYPYDTW